MDKDGSKMNAEEREYTERRSLSKLKPWRTEESETYEEPPKKILEDENSGDEENDWRFSEEILKSSGGPRK